MDTQSRICPITLEPITEPIAAPCCGGLFSSAAFFDALRLSPLCPLCRTDIRQLGARDFPCGVQPAMASVDSEAVCVGFNHHRSIRNAESDASAVHKYFESINWKVSLVGPPVSIHSHRFVDPESKTSGDAVFYFAGHGIETTEPGGVRELHLIPEHASRPFSEWVTASPHLTASAVMKGFAPMAARRVLVFDCCREIEEGPARGAGCHESISRKQGTRGSPSREHRRRAIHTFSMHARADGGRWTARKAAILPLHGLYWT